MAGFSAIVRRFVLLALFALGLGIAPWALHPPLPYAGRRAAVGFLVALEIAGWTVLLLSLAGALISGLSAYRAWRRQTRRPSALKALLLCVSCLLALALAETSVALQRASTRAAVAAGRRDPDLPLQFSEQAAAGESTVVVLGESSAVGIPYEKWLSIGRIIVWQLEQALPNRRFRLELLAEAGATLEMQHRKLAGLRVRPDVLIVYAGHNEFVSRVLWTHEVEHYLDEKSSSPLKNLLELPAQVSSLSALIRETAHKFRMSLAPPARRHRALVDVPSFTRAEAAMRLADFRRRLEIIVAYAGQVGALPVLVIPPANDTGFDPSRSILPPATTRAERRAFERAFRKTRRLEKSDTERAIQEYRALLASQPGFAETHYRLAQLLDRTDARHEAYEHFVAARDLDGLPMRCLSTFQQVYRELAERHDCLLIDGQQLFHSLGPRGLLDDFLFHDSVHPAVRGHVALAQAILDALHTRGVFGWPRDQPPPRIDPAGCAAHFGLRSEDWRPLCERGAMFYYATADLRFDQNLRRAKQRAFAAAALRIANGESPESIGLPNVGFPPLFISEQFPLVSGFRWPPGQKPGRR
jgi:lysophospholipase L1-like esterase